MRKLGTYIAERLGYLILLGLWLIFMPHSIAAPDFIIAVLIASGIGWSGFTQNYLAGDMIDRNLHLFQVIATSSLGLAAYAATSTPTAIAAVLLGDFVFQVGVNLDVREHPIDPFESGYYDVFGYKVPKPFYGKLRIAQLVIGLALLGLSLV